MNKYDAVGNSLFYTEELKKGRDIDGILQEIGLNRKSVYGHFCGISLPPPYENPFREICCNGHISMSNISSWFGDLERMKNYLRERGITFPDNIDGPSLQGWIYCLPPTEDGIAELSGYTNTRQENVTTG